MATSIFGKKKDEMMVVTSQSLSSFSGEYDMLSSNTTIMDAQQGWYEIGWYSILKTKQKKILYLFIKRYKQKE